MPLLTDADAEVRAQAAKTLGELRDTDAVQPLIALLKDASPRVRMLAALALARTGDAAAVPAAIALLRDNNDEDPYLRHAGVMILTQCGDVAALARAAGDASPAVRLGALVAMRRRGADAITRFFHDSDPRLVEEAARIIDIRSDQPLLAELGALITQPKLSDATVRRVLNAHYLLGTAASAKALGEFAARRDAPDALRVEALTMLGTWAQPASRDRVTGAWRPIPTRDAAPARDALTAQWLTIFGPADAAKHVPAPRPAVQLAAIQQAAALGFTPSAPTLAEIMVDKSLHADVRTAALDAMGTMHDPHMAEIVAKALRDENGNIRAAAVRWIGQLDRPVALQTFERVLAGDSLAEKQVVFPALARLQDAAADAMIAAWLDKLIAGQVPPELQLDIILAAEERRTPQFAEKLAALRASRSGDDPLADYRECLAGGDAPRGRRIYAERGDLSCVRCHKVQDSGGIVGPDLSKIGAEKPPEYLLESIVVPSKSIAKGFDSVLLTTDEGRTISGVVRSEDDKQITLVLADGKTQVVPKHTIEERVVTKSPMPEDLIKKLNKSDLRDLIAYLSSLK